MDESKYLKTKTGSIEDAVITSVNTSPSENLHNTRPILHLPKKKYLESKENSLEQMAINALVEKTDAVNPSELKGKLKDRKDSDIDNDGDVDQSDRFLHRRRKAIAKSKDENMSLAPKGKGRKAAKAMYNDTTTEALDKGVGSDAYANYTKNITPGEEVDPKIASRQARVQALAQRMTKKLQQRQKAVIDDAYHFESVEDAINALPPEMVKEEELSTDERKALPDSAFVFPKERKYPINDIDHARAALSMGAQHATASEYAKIKAAVKKKYPEIDVGGEKKEEVEVEAGRIDIKEYLRKRDDDEWDPKLRKGSFRRHRNIKREKHPIKTRSVEIHPEEVVHEQLPVGHRSPSAGSDSTDSYAKMQDAKRKAKAAGDKEDNWQKYHEEAEVDEANVTGITVSKKMAGITVPPKQVPASQRMDKSKNLMPAPGWKTRKAGKKSGQMTTASYDPTIDKEAELDELSPATKKSYTKKAASDISKRLHDPQDMGPVNRKKMDDRIKGIKRAAEEVEIDELSKGTLGRYVKKASHDVAGAGIDLGVTSQKKGGQTRGDVDKHAGKLVKRQRGIGKAVDKLSKEEVEVDETRSPTLVTTRTVLKPSLKGMSKKAKAILRFKDNQAKRIQNKDNRAPGEDLIK